MKTFLIGLLVLPVALIMIPIAFIYHLGLICQEPEADEYDPSQVIKWKNMYEAEWVTTQVMAKEIAELERQLLNEK